MQSFKSFYSFIYSLVLMIVAGLLFYVAKPYLPQKLFTASSLTTGVVMDDYMIKAAKQADSIALKKEKDSILASLTLNTRENSFMTRNSFVNNDSLFAQQQLKNELPAVLPLTTYTGSTNLAAFFAKLARIEQGSDEQLRIAYYGDSMIDGDLIVQDLRTMFQDRFGGSGVGFVPVYSQSENGRISVKIARSGNWDKRDFLKGNANLVGVSGDLFYPLDSVTTVTYSSGYVKHCSSLPQPVLYYGAGNENATLQLVSNGKQDTTLVKLNGTKIINTVNLSNQHLKKISLQFINAQEIPVYGVSFANKNGVIIDNFSKRGNSGLPLAAMSTTRLNGFNETLHYDLVIMQFGANVLTTKRTNYDWYAQKMVAVAKNLKDAYPQSEILFLGTADLGTKKGTDIATDDSVVALAAAQQYAAWQSQAGFISLLHLMGGTNTMSHWNSHKPKLANDDFTHFSPQGSKEIAKRLYDELITRFETINDEQKTGQ